MANNIALTAVIKAKDEASQVFSNVGKSSNNLTAGLAKLGVAAGAAALAIGTASVKMAMDFEKSMSNVATLVDTSKESITDMGNEVMEISKRVPVELADLTSALYDVRSAGISAEDAMMVLEKSAKLSVTGLGTTTEAVNLATSAINSFGFEGEEAAKVFDTIQLTIKAGKTNLSELAQSFGMVSGVANTAGVSFEELMAATAALTTSGLKASVAQSQLRAAILAIQAPTADMSEIIAELGYQSGSAMLKELGLVESMNLIDKAANGNVETLKKAYGSVEALGSALSLTGAQGETFTGIIDGMAEAEDIMEDKFAEANKAAANQFQLLKNNLNVEMINLGNKILPKIIEKMPEIIKFVEILADVFLGTADAIIWIVENLTKLKNSIDDIMNVVGTVIGYSTGIPQLKAVDTLLADKIPGYEGIIGGTEGILSKKSINEFGRSLLGGNQEATSVLTPQKNIPTYINLDLRGATVTDEQITDRITSNLMKNIGFSQLAK
jgi:TP901 family phage tail tape measure protein